MSKKINVKDIAIKAAASGAGAIAAAKMDALPPMQKITSLPVRGMIKIVLGAFLPRFIGKGKNAVIAGEVGSGMMAVGALQIANGTVLKNNNATVNGVGELATLGSSYDQIITGVGEMPTLGESDDHSNPYQ